MSGRNLLNVPQEAFWGLLADPRRMFGSTVATALGIGIFVAVNLLAQAGTVEVRSSFDDLAATEIRIVAAHAR